mgnify:CR=1 FL=1
MDRLIGMDRRQFLAGTAATALAVGGAGLLPRAARAAEPKQGGNFRIGTADYSSADSINPALSETRMSMNLQWQVRNNLIEVAPGGKLVPELAESWEGSSDAKTWTFKLRKGVEFHNGKSFTADDVVYSLNLHRKPDTKSNAKPFFAPVSDIKATGPHEVVVELSEGNVGFPSVLCHFAVVMVPDGETDFDKGIGTGGYILEEFQPGVRSLVKHNPNYWKAGRAHFDSVEILGIKDVSARTAALVSGEIDAYNFVDLKTISLLQRQKNVRIQRVPSKAHYVFCMLTDTAPYDDNNVRMAMKYAIDREEMLQKILNGYGTIGNDQPINGAYEFYDPSLKPRAYDPEKAKFYMKKAGLSNFKAQLHVSETPFAGATDASVLYREQAAKAGIDIEVIKEPEDGYWSNIWSKVPFCVTRWSGRINDDVMISSAYSDEALKTGWNESHLNNPELNKLIKAARVEFDDSKRGEMYHEMQRIISDEGGSVIPVFADLVDAVSPKVQHGELSSDWDLDGARASERWWFS